MPHPLTCWARLRHARLPAIVALTLGLTVIWQIATTGEAAGGTASSFSMIAVPPPDQERHAIALSGHSANPAAEEWDRSSFPGPPPTGVAVSTDAELMVRNVSRPTLELFLPDPHRATGAAMIVAPGGGFQGLAVDREGYPVARWLNEQGIAAFVLKYRVAPTPADIPGFIRYVEHVKPVRWKSMRGTTVVAAADNRTRDAMQAATADGLEAVGYVRAHAAQWGLSTNRIGFMGFSAGAITAISVSLSARRANRPDVIAAIYGAMADGQVAHSTAPPAFIAIASDDAVAPVTGSLTFYEALRSAGVPAELHVFQDGGHGFGVLQQGKGSDHWLEMFGYWLAAHGFESPGRRP